MELTQLLFLNGTQGGAEEGYFLLDAGASVERSLANAGARPQPLVWNSVALRGGTADMDALY